MHQIIIQVFRENLSERILITTIDDKIRDEKFLYDINRKEAKLPALSSEKINKYEKILHSNQRQIIEQAKFIYFVLGKTIKKQIQAIENQGEKQKKHLKSMGKN